MSVNVYHATNDSLEPFVGGTFYAECPIASILPYGGNEPPDGWLLCQGQEVAKIKYPDLYNVIGDSFGTASDNTKFVLPDMRESVPVGVGQNSTQTIETHDTYTVGQFKDDQYQSHVHNTYLKGHMTATSGDGWCTAYDQEVTGTRTTVPSTDTGYTSRSGSTTHGKQLGVNYIIKATTISLPSDFEAAVDEKIQDIYNVMGQNGAKNLLLVKVETGLSDGITYTVNADKSITLNGTATATVYVTVNTSFTLNETCIVTGTPKNLPDNVFMYIQNQSHTFIDYGDGVEAVSGTYGCYIQIPTGTTLTNATFYPMIRLATDTDDTYVPYAMTNKELTDRLNAVNPDASLSHTFTTQGETWTAPCDGYIMGSVDYRDTSGDIKLTVYGSDLSKGFLTYIRVVYVSNINASASLFVKKGMKLNLEIYRNLSNDGSWCRFRAIG